MSRTNQENFRGKLDPHWPSFIPSVSVVKDRLIRLASIVVHHDPIRAFFADGVLVPR